MTAPEAPQTPAERPEPSGLTSRASAFWRAVWADFDLGEDEAELLVEAVHTMSEVDALRERLELDGLTVKGSTGQTRVHPAVNEIRQHRMALARLLKQLDLAEEPETQTTRDARAAANARWGMARQRERRG